MAASSLRDERAVAIARVDPHHPAEELIHDEQMTIDSNGEPYRVPKGGTTASACAPSRHHNAVTTLGIHAHYGIGVHYQHAMIRIMLEGKGERKYQGHTLPDSSIGHNRAVTAARIHAHHGNKPKICHQQVAIGFDNKTTRGLKRRTTADAGI